MPFRLLVPPRTRPRGIWWVRPSVPGCGVETYCQSTSVPQSEKYWRGTRIASRSSAPPASRRRTEADGSDESRLVNAQPAEPAPMTTNSYRSAVTGLPDGFRCEVPDLAQLPRIDDSVVAVVHQWVHQLAPAAVDVRVPEPRPRLGVVDTRVEKNHVVELEQRDFGDALAGDLLLQLRPDVVVPVDVVVQRAWLELEDERLPDRFRHGVTPPRMMACAMMVDVGRLDRTGWPGSRPEGRPPIAPGGGMRCLGRYVTIAGGRAVSPTELKLSRTAI